MTLAVLPEGGQQPTTSGHQYCSEGDSPSRPETFSRGVQTSYSLPSDEAGSEHICVCGRASEGNCWCESILKDLKVVLPKGCFRSRVAFLLSIHEEACRLARGDAVISTRRRGSTHGDARIRRPKAPPPTMPRPRAQSLIVRSNACQRKAPKQPLGPVQPAVNPNPHGKVNQVTKPNHEENLSSGHVASTSNYQHKVSNNMCLDDGESSELATESKEEQSLQSGLDQNSYVSQAWLLFKGCERGKKGSEKIGKNDESKQDQTHARSEHSDGGNQTINQPDAETAAGESSIQESIGDSAKSNRITGLKCSSVVESKAPCENDRVSSGNKRKVSHLTGGEDVHCSTTNSAKDGGSDRPSKMGKKDLQPQDGSISDVQPHHSNNRLARGEVSPEQHMDDISVNPSRLQDEVNEELVSTSDDDNLCRKSSKIEDTCRIVCRIEFDTCTTVTEDSKHSSPASKDNDDIDCVDHLQLDACESAHIPPELLDPDSSEATGEKSLLGACAIVETDCDHFVPEDQKTAETTIRGTVYVDPSADIDHRILTVSSDSDSCTSDTTSVTDILPFTTVSEEKNVCLQSEQWLNNEKFVSKLDIDVTEKPSDRESTDVSMREVATHHRVQRKGHRALDPAKHGHLRCLISQSPLVQCEPSDSDYEDSDSESDEPSDIFSLLPYEIVTKIFRYLDTRDLGNLKCVCKNFKWLIVHCDIMGVDSLWAEAEEYRNDPCMRCGKIRDPCGDVSRCRWHSMNYSQNRGKLMWACCHAIDRSAQGCEGELHDNNWTTSNVALKRITKPWWNNLLHP